jgi:hypothetical protein
MEQERPTSENTDFPDAKPLGNSKLMKRILIGLLGGGVVLGGVITVANSGGHHKTQKTAKAADSVATPEYEQNMKKMKAIQEEQLRGDPNSLMPQMKSGETGLDPSKLQKENAAANLANSGFAAQGQTLQRPSMQNAQYDPPQQQGAQKGYENGIGETVTHGGPDGSPAGSAHGNGAPAGPLSLVSRDVQARLDGAYQSEVDHFKGTKRLAWSIDEQTYQKLKNGDSISNVEPALKDLYAGANVIKNGFGYTVPAGSRIIAVTDQPVSTDHPGYFTSTIVRPFELKGAKLICQSGQNQNDRIPVNPTKIVLASNAEITVQGQIEMGFPGLEGNVTNHWPERMLPTLVNAAIGGVFAAWSATRPGGQDRIDTRDAIVQPIVQQSVTGVQNEVTRLGKDLPNSVVVQAGQQFSILLTDKLTFKM